MRILCVDPGVNFSTMDVYTGMVYGLRYNGHTAIPYYYTRRIDVMAYALQKAYKESVRETPDLPKPNAADAALWTTELAVTWALRHQPDFVIIVSGMYWHPDGFILLKRAGIKTGIVLTETPYSIHNEMRYAELADIVWTNERTSVDVIKTINPNTHYLPHAWNPQVHGVDTGIINIEDVPQHDVVFVGTGWWERCQWLSEVDWSGINLGLYGSWGLLPKKHKLRHFIKGGVVPNQSTAALYRRAKIGLNFFRRSVGFTRDAAQILTAESLNPRSYELAATGCFHVSDYREEVTEVFGELVPTFKTSAELEQVIRKWLADDHGRQQVASRLPDAVKNHTWKERVAQMVASIQDTLESRA